GRGPPEMDQSKHPSRTCPKCSSGGDGFRSRKIIAAEDDQGDAVETNYRWKAGAHEWKVGAAGGGEERHPTEPGEDGLGEEGYLVEPPPVVRALHPPEGGSRLLAISFGTQCFSSTSSSLPANSQAPILWDVPAAEQLPHSNAEIAAEDER